MNNQTKTAGYLFILAAITFWISWFLMPDPGTTDAAHILNIVKQSRMSVLFSVIIQIISSILYIAALILLLVKTKIERKSVVVGSILFGIGVMGLCADAFFHFLAWCMTHETVTIQNDVVRVMELMQTSGVVLLAPILLPIFIGCLVLAIGLRKEEVISKKAVLLIAGALILGIVLPVCARLVFSYNGAAISMIILGLFAAGQVLMGWELIPDARKKYQVTELLEVYW